jgi:hypothetical protein
MRDGHIPDFAPLIRATSYKLSVPSMRELSDSRWRYFAIQRFIRT